MAEIKHGAPGGLHGAEYSDFLFATIGADRRGEPLSVVSALARMDLDPWAEAAKFAKLPVGIATQRLSSLIAALQEVPSARHESVKIAGRLIALLPRRLSAELQPSSSVKAAPNARYYLAIYVGAFAFMLAFQVLIHSVQPPASHRVLHIASIASKSKPLANIPTPT